MSSSFGIRKKYLSLLAFIQRNMAVSLRLLLSILVIIDILYNLVTHRIITVQCNYIPLTPGHMT